MIKFVYLLWLISTALVMGASDYQCRRLNGVQQNCTNSPRIRMTKTMNNYNLALCSNSRCIPTGNEGWIKCKDVCPICRSLPGQYDCNSSKPKCEEQLDQFLNDFCASARYTSTVTTTSTRYRTTTREITSTITKTLLSTAIATTCSVAINSVFLKHTPIAHSNITLNNEATAVELSNERAIVALGALLGLTILLLAVFATSWILTCSKMKRRVTLEHDRMNSIGKYNKQELHFHNPSYEASSTTTTQQPLSQARDEISSKTKESRQTYDNLSRGQINEDKEEENVYHMLENPGDDDYEDPDRDQGEEMVDGVAEYEVPVQLHRNN